MNTRRLATICAALAAAVQPLYAQEFAWTGTFERQLSAYRIFVDPARQQPAPGFVPYDVITPLFTDYADKHRFVYIPEGRSMTYDPDQAFGMPVGSVLVKTFSYPLDARHPEQGRRLVETRLMVHTPNGWTGAAYLWNDAQTDAALKVAGAEVPVDWIDDDGYCRSIKYLVPDMNQCKNCHRDTAGSMQPISIKARHLNRDAPGGSGSQLGQWVRDRILDQLPAEGVPAMARWDDARAPLAARALAYLEMNCAHCHNPNGLASHTRLDLRWIQDDPAMRGVMKRPTSSGNASRDRYFAIVPGDAANSFLLHRMASSRPDVRMPPIGRTTAHDEAVNLIAAWIDSL